MAVKQDRRIRKTKSQLRQGLAKLMTTKSIKEITVKELVEEVDINRSTFYLHYTDIYDLLEQTEAELKAEIMDIIGMENAKSIEDTMPYVMELFTFIADNKEIAQALLGPNGDVAFINQIEDIIASHCMNIFRQYLPDTTSLDFSYANAFCITGCIGLIKYWMGQQFSESPEHMAKLAYNLVTSALRPHLKNM